MTNKYLKNISIKLGDITKEDTDGIVNAANPSLLGGGGVDGAIHRVAGSRLLEECKTLNGCLPGDAKYTKGYNLKAKYIIHTPGPVYNNGKNEERVVLENSYKNSLIIAKQLNLKSISFPAISTGVYNYPKNEAAEVAITTVLKFMEENNYMINIYFVLFDQENYNVYKNYIEGIK